MEMEKLDKILSNMVVRIETEKERGTGFYISEDLILTAYHVVEDCDIEEKIKEDLFSQEIKEEQFKIDIIDTESGNSINKAFIFDKNEELDIALLKIRTKKENIKILPFKLNKIKEYDKWRAYGCFEPLIGTNNSFEKKMMKGEIYQTECFKKNKYDLNLESKYLKEEPCHGGYDGLSGSPIVINGKISGVIVQEEQSEIDSPLKAVSTYKIKHFLQKNKIDLKTIGKEFLLDLSFTQEEIEILDNNTIHRINELNTQYKFYFKPIGQGYKERKEVKQCIEELESGNSIIMHGKAGCGKSGCTQGIILYCEEKQIPYLAIRLDDRMPEDSVKKWSKSLELGQNICIDKAINYISKNKKGVIILDQLDALRWTKSNSRKALITCTELISRINEINEYRDNNISIIIACRTYDYENDNNIRVLFNENNTSMKWKEIKVGNLDEEIVKDIVGDNYNYLSKKMKNILSIPNNLYIWEHLDIDRRNNEYTSANALIEEWRKQIAEKAASDDIDENEINKIIEEILNNIDKKGRVYVNVKILDTTTKTLDYLNSSGFINLTNNKVSFSHQSISDYLFARDMLRKYYDGQNIIQIIGPKEKQTPQRRYQVQMLLQDIQSDDEQDFIDVGKEMLESQDIRFYIKYVFFEVLGQSTEISEVIKDFILEYIDSEFKEHIIDTVIRFHPIFVELLIDEGILAKWMESDQMKEIVLDLLESLRPNYNEKVIEFIKSYILDFKENANRLYACLGSNVYEDRDIVFELRMDFYKKYPELFNYYIDFPKLVNENEFRAVEILELILNMDEIKDISYIEGEFLAKKHGIYIKNPKIILKKLLKYIPREKDINHFSEWVYHRYSNNKISRLCIELIKKANESLIKIDPQKFIDIYQGYIVKNYAIFNEIILTGFELLPTDFSDQVIYFINKNFKSIIFDKSSGEKNYLNLIKRVIKKHSEECSDELFEKLENIVINYIDDSAKEWYEYRIEYNKQKDHEYVYWSFWGDLQVEILPCLSQKRISIKTKELLNVLKRRFENLDNRYKNYSSDTTWGNVVSPIDKKDLSDKQWKKILTNKKILVNKRMSRWNGEEYISSRIDDFASTFGHAASLNPKRFINLVLSMDDDIEEIYINHLLNQVAFSEYLKDVPVNLLEKLILKYRYDYESDRARYICEILYKKENANWSKDIIDILNDIAINHKDPKGEISNIISQNGKENNTLHMIQTNAMNCTRGCVAMAIEKLLWDNEDLYNDFKSTFEILSKDVNPAVRYAAFRILYPIYNIDKEYASYKIIEMIQRDYKFAGDRGMKQIFFLIYEKYNKDIDKVLLECFNSNDESLIANASFTIAEMYIRHNRYENLLCNINQRQVKFIINMALLYFKKEEYNEIAKGLIKKCIEENPDLKINLSRLFYDSLIDLDRDKDFLIYIMESRISDEIIYGFVEYIEKNATSIIDYKDIILRLSRNAFENYPKLTDKRCIIDNELTKLIILLYDETVNETSRSMKKIANECLELWDFMFEKRISGARVLLNYMLSLD
ncbi:serine protease [Intestinibacter bartlettii]|uniref:serine protease n=1 Tax=Intestinibacter bartlettii TaxID=261299 RepID=UPI0026DAF31C|nr:serine protease [Intestinibacter bartlettii]